MSVARIAMVVNAPGLGGVTEVAYQLLKQLAGKRHALHVYFLKDAGDDDGDRQGQLDRFRDLDVGVTAAPADGGKIGVIAHLAEWLRDNRIDIVHTHSYRPNLYGRMGGALDCRDRVRMIAHYHNHYDDKWLNDSSALSLEKTLAPRTDAMIAVGESVREHVAGMLSIGRARIDVVENGVALERFVPRDTRDARTVFGLPQEALVVGLVGRVCEQKGQEDLVEAAAHIAHEGQDIRFACFGDIEDKALHRRLQQRIGELGLGDRMVFAGHVADVPMAYAACDIVAVPSRWEGFPLVIGEAMACRRAIVAARVSAIPDMTGEGAAAMLVAPRDPEELARAICSLVRSRSRREGLAEQGYRLSSRFSWARAAEKVESIYARVLAGPRAGA